MDNNKEYIEILIDSLKKKISILDEIKNANEKQRIIAMEMNIDDGSFDEIVQTKDMLIARLNELDKGFDTVYNRVKDELTINSSHHIVEIAELKGLISTITGMGMDIQAQEKRNEELIMRNFDNMRRKVNDTKTSRKVAANYYQTMSKSNYVEPQFMDKKK